MVGVRQKLFAAVVAVVTLSATQVQALEVPVTGDLTNRPGTALGTFDGILEIDEFKVNDDGALVAVGTLTGDVLKKSGKLKQSIEEAVEIPVVDLDGIETDGVCQILTLSLGPLDLDLLGLVVHLDEVNLDISADPAGGLLGELLCGLLGDLDLLGAIGDLLGLDLSEVLDLADLLDLPIGDLVAILDEVGLLDDVLDLLNDLTNVASV